MRQTFSCLSELGGTTNLIRLLFCHEVSISKGLVDFCKFDNLRRFFRDNSAKDYRRDLPKGGKDVSR